MYLQDLPLAEVNIVAGVVSVAFDDNRGQDADCSNTHLKLRGQRLDLLLEFVQGAMAAKVCGPCLVTVLLYFSVYALQCSGHGYKLCCIVLFW